MSKRRSINFAKRVAASFAGSHLDRNSIVAQLRSQGWKQIGRGCFAIVLEHPDHNYVVIKVGHTYSTNKYCRKQGLRDGFDRYVDFANYTRSKLALKVYGELTWAGDVYLAVVERLYPVNGNTKASKRVTGAAYKTKWGSELWRHVKASPHAVRFFESLRWHGQLDIHGKNIMQRQDGTIVVADPLTIQGASYV